MAKKFNPEGSGYDYKTAEKWGMERQVGGKNAGHLGSVVPASAEDTKKHNLPRGTSVILKGSKHPTFHKAVEAESRRKSRELKVGKRYYSVPHHGSLGDELK